MTREEALKILRKDLLSNLVDYYASEELQDAIDTIISQPSLPSNLDEVAKKIAYGVCKQLPNGEEKDGIVYYAILAAKACAEWMAGQFQKIEGEPVDWYSTSDGKDYCCGVKTQDAFEVPEGFYIKKGNDIHVG